MRNLLFILIWSFLNETAICQEAGYSTSNYISDAGLYQRFVDAAPSWLIVAVPILIGILLLCRALAEILFIFKDATANVWDNKAWSIVTKTADILARVLGQIGVGMPKQMIIEKAEKAAQKKASK